LLAEGVHPRPRSSAPVLAAVLGAAICCGHLSHRLFDGLLTALAWA
jgi:hypothetical protein